MLKRPHTTSMLLTILVILGTTTTLSAQTLDDVSRLIARRQLDSAELIAKKVIASDGSNPDAYFLMGRVLRRKGAYNDAIGYLDKAWSFKNAKPSTMAWVMWELSTCNFALGNYAKSRDFLRLCKALNATANVNSAAQESALQFGYDKFYDSWTTRETPHFIFHIQDTSSLQSVSKFLQKKEHAFDSISGFLGATLPKKIDYFVWADEAQGKSMLKSDLAFTESSLCLTHTGVHHTLGHEMAHSISYYAAKPRYGAPLIMEGICVYLDLSRKTDASVLRGKGEAIGSVAEVWKNNKKLGADIIYPLGGELVQRLITTFGKEKFMQLLANQSYDSAKQIYGSELDMLLSKLDEDLRR